VSASDIYHTWNGLTFGSVDGVETYGLLDAEGLDDLSSDADNLGGTGDGSGIGALYLNAGSWVTSLDFRASAEAAMIVKRDDLKEATIPAANRRAVAPYVIHHGTDIVRTVYARVTQRTLPTNREMLQFLVAECDIAFEAPDPTLYGPTATVVLDPTDSATITNSGPVVSGRWSAVIEGPVVNPRLVSSVGHVIRYVGYIPDGDTLTLDLWPRGGSWTLEGANIYGRLDGGSSSRLPDWLQFAPGSQTVTYTVASGSGTCTLTTRSAYT